MSPILIAACARHLSSPALSGIGGETAAGGGFDQSAVAEAQQILGIRTAVCENERQEKVERARAAEPGARRDADYLRPYLPMNQGVRLSPLVGTVDRFLEAMKGREWPDLTMPQITQED